MTKNVSKHSVLWMVIAALGGCAGSVGEAMTEPSTRDDGSTPARTDGSDPAQVEMSFTAVDVAGMPMQVQGSQLFSREAGSSTESLNDLTLGGTAPAAPVGMVMSIGVDGQREVGITMSAPGLPKYLTLVATGSDASDFSGAPFHLLSSKRIDAAYQAAGLVQDPLRASVLVHTASAGAHYELLVNSTDAGPSPIYIDGQGRVVPDAEASLGGGWVLFPNVAIGLHAIAFGHASERCEQVASMGWPGFEPDTTLAFALPTYTTLVEGTTCGPR